MVAMTAMTTISYFQPAQNKIEDGILEIPHVQQRMLADRKFFSLMDGTLIRLDIDQDMQNNGRYILKALANLLGIRRIDKIKKPELSRQLQERIVFCT